MASTECIRAGLAHHRTAASQLLAPGRTRHTRGNDSQLVRLVNEEDGDLLSRRRAHFALLLRLVPRIAVHTPLLRLPLRGRLRLGAPAPEEALAPRWSGALGLVLGGAHRRGVRLGLALRCADSLHVWLEVPVAQEGALRCAPSAAICEAHAGLRTWKSSMRRAISLVLISAIVKCGVLSPGVPETRRSTLSRSCYKSFDVRQCSVRCIDTYLERPSFLLELAVAGEVWVLRKRCEVRLHLLTNVRSKLRSAGHTRLRPTSGLCTNLVGRRTRRSGGQSAGHGTSSASAPGAEGPSAGRIVVSMSSSGHKGSTVIMR